MGSPYISGLESLRQKTTVLLAGTAGLFCRTQLSRPNSQVLGRPAYPEIKLDNNLRVIHEQQDLTLGAEEGFN